MTTKTETFTNRLESLIDEAKTSIQTKIMECGTPSVHISDAKCIKIYDEDFMFTIGNGYIEEVHMDKLVSYDGFHYSFEVLPTSDFIELVDHINKSFGLINCECNVVVKFDDTYGRTHVLNFEHNGECDCWDCAEVVEDEIHGELAFDCNTFGGEFADNNDINVNIYQLVNKTKDGLWSRDGFIELNNIEIVQIIRK